MSGTILYIPFTLGIQQRKVGIKMNGIKMNGFNSIFSNPLIGNKGIFSNPLQKTEKTKESLIPKGNISGIEESAENAKNGLAIQMNADKDTLEISEWRVPDELTAGDMTEAERKEMAKQFLEERLEVEARYKNGEIGWEERKELWFELNHKYEINDIRGYKADGKYCDLWGSCDEIGDMDNVEIIFFRGKADTPPRVTLSKEEINQIPISEIPQALPTETEEESDNLNMEEALKENAGQATGVISDKNEEKLSARLVEKLMEDYAFQGSKSISELQKERIEKQNTKEDSPQRFLAYA